MSGFENYTTQGGLHISEEVIATIAKTAIGDIDGIAGFGNRPVHVKGILRSKSSPISSVKVTNTDEKTEIDVYLILSSNAKIQPVAEQAQQKIKEAVQNMTGKTIDKVNVHICGIVFPEE